MNQTLLEGAGEVLARRTSRRGLLARAALAGSAMMVAPLRYLLRPVDAWAVISPGQCGGGLCDDGYTAFCCEINHGRNVCPPGTFVGGWWMCTAYRGGGLCEQEGVRYYVDCNRLPGHYVGECRCANGNCEERRANGNCEERRANCNVFRYGQCNTQIEGTTEVTCRVVVCRHPAEVEGFNCSDSLAVDDNTCSHDWGCLTPLVEQEPGAGGA